MHGFFNFWVDLCLNGQQILGKPFKLTFYKVVVERLTPDNCLLEGSIPIYFQGKGIFESDFQKVKIKKGAYERVFDPKWDALGKRMFFYMPPFDWLQSSSQKNQEIPDQDFMVQCVQKKASVFDALAGPAQPPSDAPAQEPEAAPPSLLDRQFDIYLSLSANDWIFSGKVTYFEPRVDDFFPVDLEPADAENFALSLHRAEAWKFFGEYFGADFEPLDRASEVVLNFEADSKRSKTESKAEALKTSERSKSKTKSSKSKDKSKSFEAARAKLQSEVLHPGDHLLLLSRSGFVPVQSKEALRARFRHKKFQGDGEVLWCNPHMLLARVPELPYEKPKPEAGESEKEGTESQSEDKGKRKKKAKAQEWEPFDVLPVTAQLTFNGVQFGPESQTALNAMLIDSQVQGEERQMLHQRLKKPKKKQAK